MVNTWYNKIVKKIHKVKHICIGCESNDHKPKILLESGIVFVLAVSVFVLVVTFGSRFAFRSGVLPAEVYSSVLISLANDTRADMSLNTLSQNDLLTVAAQLKANDMVANGYFAHTSPSGQTPWYWLDQVGYGYMYAGENLAVNFNESELVNDAWLNSPTHYANIVNEHFTEIGIATAKGKYKGKDSVYVVQFFASPKITPAPKTTETTQIVTEPTTQEEQQKEPEETQQIAVSPLEVSVTNDSYVEDETASNPTIAGAMVLGENVTTVSGIENALAEFITNPSKFSKTIYFFFIGVILIAILSSLSGSIRKKEYKHILYGVVLIMLILSLILVLDSSQLGQIVI